MVTQVEYEAYSFQYQQEMMQAAQASRALHRMRKSNPKKKAGFNFIISWVRSKVSNQDFSYQVQPTQHSKDEKNLISS